MICIGEDYIFFENVNGKLHRLNGPAYIEGDYQAWYQEDKLHRLDGPAIIVGNDQYWYIEGKKTMNLNITEN